MTSNQRWKNEKTNASDRCRLWVSGSDSGTRPPWVMRETRPGGGLSTAGVPPGVAEGQAGPAAASNPSPGPDPPLQAQRGLPNPGVELAAAGQRGLRRPAGRAEPGDGVRGGTRAPLTCWYRLPQAGSTAASAANANAMAQPAAGKESERAS